MKRGSIVSPQPARASIRAVGTSSTSTLGGAPAASASRRFSPGSKALKRTRRRSRAREPDERRPCLASQHGLGALDAFAQQVSAWAQSRRER
jgi:hypothetical protein